MTTPVIIDLIAASVLLGFTVAGARRGLFRTLAGLLIVVLAMTGARYAAERAVTPAAEFLAPMLERRIQAKLEETLPDTEALRPGQMPEAETPEVEDLLGLLGVREARLEELAERARAHIRDTGASALTAAAMSAAEPALYGLFYALAFSLLSVGLGLLARAMDLMLKLPVLHSANALCGGLAGALEGLLILWIGTLLIQGLGVPLDGSRLGWMIDMTHLV